MRREAGDSVSLTLVGSELPPEHVEELVGLGGLLAEAGGGPFEVLLLTDPGFPERSELELTVEGQADGEESSRFRLALEGSVLRPLDSE